MKTLKYLIPALILTIVYRPAMSQRHILADIVKGQFSGSTQIKIVNDLVESDPIYENMHSARAVNKGKYFSYNRLAAEDLIARQPELIALSIPIEGSENWVLDLVTATETFHNTSVVTASGKPFVMGSLKAAFYRGVVRGQEESSMVSISIFENEIMGLISTGQGNLNLGKLEGSDTHILYEEKEIEAKSHFSCSTEDMPLSAEEQGFYEKGRHERLSGAVLPKCVNLYYETEYDIFQNKGSVAAVVQYITGLHNQVASIYLNEGIKTPLSQIRVWDVSDPYFGITTGALLSEFQAYTNSFNGNLGQLLTFRSIGGGRAAGFTGICNPNVDFSLAVSGIYPFYNDVPVYSWPIMVVTHEFGHLFGSRHTHACVWNGNNTAIDGCSGVTEGGCPLPPIPPNGGTIMSYCHQQPVGINFLEGFGTQPGDVIRARVSAGTCLGVCCRTEVIIFGKYVNTLTESGNWIASSGTTTISPGNRVKLDANPTGGYILLSPGFMAMTNSVFVAQAYNGCSPGEPLRPDDQGNLISDIREEHATLAEGDYGPQDNRLTVLPNPTTGGITVTHPPDVRLLELYDMAGQLVLSFKPNGDPESRIDLTALSAGLYFLRAGGYPVQKIVKQ